MTATTRSEVIESAFAAARMIVTEGIGEGRQAHGFFIVIGDTATIFAEHWRRDVDNYECPYGTWRIDYDRRDRDLYISQYETRKKAICSLFFEDGAVVVDRDTGRIHCGGFFVKNTTHASCSAGARHRAASSMATQAGTCYVILASESICGSVHCQPPARAAFTAFPYSNESRHVPIQEDLSLLISKFKDMPPNKRAEVIIELQKVAQEQPGLQPTVDHLSKGETTAAQATIDAVPKYVRILSQKAVARYIEEAKAQEEHWSQVFSINFDFPTIRFPLLV
ncbi:hypothetical protein CTAYLR_008461 [Chrysophaeum taylorii]|uniref:DAC domain-containing protein n=1 Tax=Chrysophaeum taylorii TaxID=2483200 RepID=A0AAD7UC68_9STRA|nr:hypothetical protein CTAYLR_008461 [Chrysophaeum taylorii]